MPSKARPHNERGQWQCNTCKEWFYPDEFPKQTNTYCKRCLSRRQTFYTARTRVRHILNTRHERMQDLKAENSEYTYEAMEHILDMQDRAHIKSLWERFPEFEYLGI